MKQILLPMFILASLSLPTKTLAHGTKISYENVRSIVINAVYDTGKPMAKAQVSVYAPVNSSQPWLTGTTDKKGRFLFQPDSTKSGKWEVKVRHLGHGGVIQVPGIPATPQTEQTESPTVSTPTQVVSVSSQSDSLGYTPLQQGLMIGSVIWGCIGTALFFSRYKKNAHI